MPMSRPGRPRKPKTFTTTAKSIFPIVSVGTGGRRIVDEMKDDCSSEETNDWLYADRHNFYKVGRMTARRSIACFTLATTSTKPGASTSAQSNTGRASHRRFSSGPGA
jgi:hypothetical protein